MKRLVLTAICLLGASAATVRAVEPVPVTVRSEATVAGREIRLKDVSDAKGPMGDLVIGAAPLPGRTILLTPGDIRMRLRAAHCDLSKITIPGSVRVSGGEVAPAKPIVPMPLKEKDLVAETPAPVIVVAARARVAVRVSLGDVEVTTSGQTWEAGRLGQTIRVRLDGDANRPARDIKAVVLSPDLVSVEE